MPCALICAATNSASVVAPVVVTLTVTAVGRTAVFALVSCSVNVYVAACNS